MGMAASQARFLQLTARRTNIEYMGQQINQQRLALANASAGLFEKMLSMVPPTPPSSQDDKYFTQGYKFTDPADEVQKSFSWSTTDTATSGVTFTAADDITITDTAGVAQAGLVTSALLNAGTVDADAVATALGKDLTASETTLGYRVDVRYVNITHNIYNPDGQYQTVSRMAPALLKFDNLNRLIDMTLLDKNMDARPTAVGTAAEPESVSGGEKLTYGGTFDDVTYQDDVNKYEFQKASYDYQIERINQETRQIQSQDKSLELKMKQLDTEHNAVQTEMEAVQKVLQKNIEGSFKTFA